MQKYQITKIDPFVKSYNKYTSFTDLKLLRNIKTSKNSILYRFKEKFLNLSFFLHGSDDIYL